MTPRLRLTQTQTVTSRIEGCRMIAMAIFFICDMEVVTDQQFLSMMSSAIAEQSSRCQVDKIMEVVPCFHRRKCGNVFGLR